MDILSVEDDIDTNKKGDYKVTYKADTLTLTRIVHVVDNEPPKVIIDEDKQTLVLNLNGDVDKFKDIHFFDEADELIENVDEEDNIDITTIGDYTIKYHACDTSNNCVDYEREVEVKDLEPPVIKLNKGNLTLTVGKNYQEYGATAKDNSGDVQAINIDNKVDTSKEGVYEVKYTVCDLSNNCAEKIRTVTVKKEELISGTFKSHPTIDGTIPSTLTLNSTTKKATFVINQCEGMDSISGTYKVSGNTITVTLSRAINEKYKTIKFTKINNDTLKMNTDIMSCAPSGKNEKYSRS